VRLPVPSYNPGIIAEGAATVSMAIIFFLASSYYRQFSPQLQPSCRIPSVSRLHNLQPVSGTEICEKRAISRYGLPTFSESVKNFGNLREV